jgi:hypothetical protein
MALQWMFSQSWLLNLHCLSFVGSPGLPMPLSA